MEYILSLLMLILNLVNYEHPLGSVIFLSAGTILFAAMFYVVFRKTKCYMTTCLIMMCYTWQISWINILGGPTSDLQLPWFYVLGVMLLAYALINIKKCFSRNYGIMSFLSFLVFLVVFNIPLLTSHSKINGIKEYVIIAFFVVLLFVSYMYSDIISKENYNHFKKAFIWAVFISSAFLIFQYVMYVYAGVSLFKMQVMPSFSGEYQVSCYLLMEDHSCSTIMFGCAVFYILDKLNKKSFGYLMPALGVIVISMAMTSRRTSTISLVLVLALYVFLHYKGLGKKSLYIFAFTMLGIAFIYYLTITRPVDSLSQLLDDNGRISSYIKALKVLWNHPLGVGYDNIYLASQTGGIVPHNTVLRWLAMGGYPFTVVMLFIIAFVFIKSYKKKMTAEFWVILYSLIASSFIPDIINGRFFVIPCMMVLLYSADSKKAPDGPDIDMEIN